uniref:Ubiquitin carboxyl-terminal hydrolase n=1 Tax=Globisporangium ultimum (strain ATCC 200006 / CBS 805.95 / DAOM BR144) TaxID=431595 RepID=K3X6K0_GLOUD
MTAAAAASSSGGRKRNAVRRFFSLSKYRRRFSSPSAHAVRGSSSSIASFARVSSSSAALASFAFASNDLHDHVDDGDAGGAPVTATTHFSPYLCFPQQRDNSGALSNSEVSREYRRRRRQATLSTCARREYTRRCIDTWTSAELYVLRELVDRAMHPRKYPRRHPDEHFGFQLQDQQQRRKSSTLQRVSLVVESLLAHSADARSSHGDDDDENAAHDPRASLSYSHARRLHYRDHIDQRLQLRKRKHLIQLFPMLECIHHGVQRQLFCVLDRNRSGRIEFTELCEMLTYCHVDSLRQNIDFVFLWFHKARHGGRVGITAQGVHLLVGTVKELVATHETLASMLKMPQYDYLDALPDTILQGQQVVSLDQFRERIAAHDDVIRVLLTPFNIVRTAMNEMRLWHAYQASSEWHHEGNTAYVLSKSWWNQWIEYILYSTDFSGDVLSSFSAQTFGSSTQTQHHHEVAHERFRCRPGPVDNRDICADPQAGTLLPNLILNVHFVVVPPRIWQALMQLYGGGPSFPRQLVVPLSSSYLQERETHPEPRKSSIDSAMQAIGSSELYVDLYPISLPIRLIKRDAARVTMIFARRFLLNRDTTLKEIVHRLGLQLGENAAEITFWVRRQKLDPWKRIEYSLDAPRSSLRDLRFKSSFEVLVDFQPLETGDHSKEPRYSRHRRSSNASTSSVAQSMIKQKPFSIGGFRSMGNDFVCTEPGLSRFLGNVPIKANMSDSTTYSPDRPSSDNYTRSTKQSSESRDASLSGILSPNAVFSDIEAQLVARQSGFSLASSRRLTMFPGIRATGLLNLGNTCFMNCALQCLGHSPIFREYFLSQRHFNDINKKNVLGTRGKIATVFTRLLESMWRQRDTSFYVPVMFRDEFTKFRRNFQETRQHDAHEFIVALLDSLHEDLNHGRSFGDEETSSCFPYFGNRSRLSVAEDEVAMDPPSSSSTVCLSDAAIGNQSWQNHTRVNASVVVDLFHGQTRSETICATCGDRKVAFDPTLFFSLPIPEAKYLRLEVNVVLQVRTNRANDNSTGSDSVGLAIRPVIRRGFWIKRGSNTGSLSDQVAAAYNLQGNRILLVEVRKNRIKRVIEGDEQIESVAHVRELYAYERAWTLSEIPAVPPIMTKCDMNFVKAGPLNNFGDLQLGSRVDAIGFHGEWHAGSVVDLIDEPIDKKTGSDSVVVRVDTGAHHGDQPSYQRICVHFDGFSSKWNKWFVETDWLEQRIAPLEMHRKSVREVFEVQVIHRMVVSPSSSPPSFLATRRGRAHSIDEDEVSSSNTNNSRAFQIFGVPLFVTIASDKTSRDLHHAILLQASRFIPQYEVNEFACGDEAHTSVDKCAAVQLPALPFTTRVTNLEDVSGTLGDELPFDNSGILQHFSAQSVIVLDWSKDSYTDNLERVAPEDDMHPPGGMEEGASAVDCSAQTPKRDTIITLDKCMDAFLKNESISLEDHWICERCGVAREGLRKSDLWRLPDLVMVQLKRFQYFENQHRQKVRAFVDFPIDGLDFSKWMGGSSTTTTATTNTSAASSPDYVYDLYAVVNHVGGLTRGHYTATCRYDRAFEESARVFAASRDAEVPLNDLWYRFDDEKAVEIAAGDVVTDAAYVLFYKRRTLSPHNILEYTL